MADLQVRLYGGGAARLSQFEELVARKKSRSDSDNFVGKVIRLTDKTTSSEGRFYTRERTKREFKTGFCVCVNKRTTSINREYLQSMTHATTNDPCQTDTITCNTVSQVHCKNHYTTCR